MSADARQSKVGELRPSQVLTTFGIGSVVDLPNISVMVMGLDDWTLQDSVEINEVRLLASVKETLGSQVSALRSPPVPPESSRFQTGHESSFVGVPVAPFPRWMVCPYCRRLAKLSSGLFELQGDGERSRYRPDRVRYVHGNCNKRGKPPTAVPARFIVVCKQGHLDDFPWVEFVHRGSTQCAYSLRLVELGASGEAADVEVRCETCGAARRMADAFRLGSTDLPRCRGRRPHLRDFEENGCKDENGEETKVRAMLQGASNSWFPVLLTALSVPQSAGGIDQLVDDNWTVLEKVQNQQNIELLRQVAQLRDFAEYSDSDIWEAVERKRAGSDADEPSDLKSPEWETFSNPGACEPSRDFKLRQVAPPRRYSEYFEKIVLAERLREVRALVGFTRIESPGDYDNPAAFPEAQRARLSRKKPTWVPASETRGEGIFFQFSEAKVVEWSSRVGTPNKNFFEAHKLWRSARGLEPGLYYPEIRFVLLHSFAHALIRQLSVECGYTTASLRERIYSRAPGDEPPMAGVLIYTAASDSEGTLGGLVSLGEPVHLERHLDQALDAMRLCSSDPLCAEHHPYLDGITLHAAACHACLFAPETSCERGNKYLDRSLLVPTVEKPDFAFFDPSIDPSWRRDSSDAPITPSVVSSSDEQVGTPQEPELANFLEYADERCHNFLRDWTERSRPLPKVGFELQDAKGRVIAQAELAWSSSKVAVILPEEQENVPTFRDAGWVVFSLADLDKPEDIHRSMTG